MIPGHRHLEIGQPSKPRASGDDPSRIIDAYDPDG